MHRFHNGVCEGYSGDQFAAVQVPHRGHYALMSAGNDRTSATCAIWPAVVTELVHLVRSHSTMRNEGSDEQIDAIEEMQADTMSWMYTN